MNMDIILIIEQELEPVQLQHFEQESPITAIPAAVKKMYHWLVIKQNTRDNNKFTAHLIKHDLEKNDIFKDDMEENLMIKVKIWHLTTSMDQIDN